MQSLGMQIASLVGALLILLAYIGHQLKWMRSQSALYNLLNAFGSGLLAYIAFRPFQLGFVILEACWAVVSVYALLRSRRAAPAAGRT